MLTSLLPDVVLLSPEELLPEGLPPATPVHDLYHLLHRFFLPGPSCETELEELPEELLPPGVEEPPEEELPPVPVESVVPERKEPETIPVRPSFVCVLPSYSWERNWNT